VTPTSPPAAASTNAPAAPAAAPSGASINATVPGVDTTSTTTSLTTGPTTSIKATGIPPETRAFLNDAAITASIKADLLRDPDLSALKIDVDTRDGVVTLNGLAANETAKTRAERMAQSVKGVREVRNHLSVKQA
jgi:osmotically-inducible protein OsmY